MLAPSPLCSTAQSSFKGTFASKSSTAEAYREFISHHSSSKRPLNTGRGWVLALIGHISCVVFWILFQSLSLPTKVQPVPFILELVPADLPLTEPPAEDPQELFEEIKLPEIVLPDSIELPDIEEAPEAPLPEPETPPAKKISYEEFLKKHPKLKEKPKAKKAPQPAKKKPQTDKKPPEKAIKPLPNAPQSSAAKPPSSAPVSASALANFNAILLKKIDNAWLKPVASITQGLITIVEFTVARNGQISQVSIIQSSGNPLVDQSVLDAFARVGNAGKPPHDEGGTYRLTFKLTE